MDSNNIMFFPKSFIGNVFDDYFIHRDGLDLTKFIEKYEKMCSKYYSHSNDKFSGETFYFNDSHVNGPFEISLTWDREIIFRQGVMVMTRNLNDFNEIFNFINNGKNFTKTTDNGSEKIYSGTGWDIPYHEYLTFMKITTSKNYEGHIDLYLIHLEVLFKPHILPI